MAGVTRGSAGRRGSEACSAHHHHLLASRLPERLRPLDLARVALVLEGAVALRTAELEYLRVVPHECHAVPRVARPRAHVARLDAHDADRAPAASTSSSSRRVPRGQQRLGRTSAKQPMKPTRRLRAARTYRKSKCCTTAPPCAPASRHRAAARRGWVWHESQRCAGSYSAAASAVPTSAHPQLRR